MRFWLTWTKIYLTIVLPLVYSKVKHEWNEPAEIKYIECKHPTCEEEGQDIAISMNTNAEPCEDFFEYVCGNWSQSHVDPYKQYRNFPWNVESVLSYKAYMKIRESLEEPIYPYELTEDKRAKNLYEACMNLPWMGKLQPEEVRSIVEHAGQWPMFPQKPIDDNAKLDWIPIHNYYFKLTGESALFGISLKLNPMEKNLPILQIRKCSSPYGIFNRDAGWTIKETLGYTDFLETIAKVAKSPSSIHIPKQRLHKYFNEVLQLRIKLQKVVNAVAKEKQTVMTIDYLNHFYNEKHTKKSKTAEIPWLSVIKALYEQDRYAKITEKSIILLGYPQYFEELYLILSKVSSQTIVNHIHLYFIERHLRLTKEQEDLFYMSRSLAPMKPVSKMRVFPEKWFGCIEKHGMPITIGKIYVKDHTSKVVLSHVRRLVEDIRMMIVTQINDTKWLIDATKSETKMKILQIKTIIGYPPCYDRRSSRKHDDCTVIIPQYPEGKYDQYTNRIAVTAAYFQPPMYDLNLPFNMNYASLGAIVGHEIYHSIDSIGIMTDDKGKKTKWWPESMEMTYKLKRQCFSLQYGRYKIKELEGYIDAPRKTYRHMTLDEDISDTMGLKAAYEAYRLKLMQENHQCQLLPHLPKQYTCDQLFFISFARTFCFSATPRQLMFAVRYDEHSTPRLRVNGAVSNMKEFTEAFQCQPKKPLNPRTRCDVWE